MGQMCSSPLEYLISEYGEDVGKFVVVEKTKQYFDEKYPAVKKELSTQTGKFKEEALHKVEEQSTNCLTKVTSTISELKDSKKAEVEMFEKTSDKKVEDFVGVHEIKDKFDELKSKSNEAVSGMEKQILKQADVLAQKQRGVIEAQKPSIPLYDKLPDCLKTKVWEEGEKKFGSQISEQKQKQEKFLKEAINFDEMKKKFGGNLPSQDVSHITSSIEDKLQQVKSAVSMGDMGSKLKGLF